MNPMGAITLIFRVQIFGIKLVRNKKGESIETRADHPSPGPPEPLDGEDPTYWPASYRRWTMMEQVGAGGSEDSASEMGSFGFGDDPNIVPGIFILRIDPSNGATRLFRSISSSENSSGTAFRWYVNAKSQQ